MRTLALLTDVTLLKLKNKISMFQNVNITYKFMNISQLNIVTHLVGVVTHSAVRTVAMMPLL